MSQNGSSGSRCANLCDAIREVSPTVVLVRIYSANRAVTHLYEADFYRVLTHRDAEDTVARMVRQAFGHGVDWRRAHDFHLPTGKLYLAPEPHQQGFIPEDDFTFGLAPARLIEISDGADS